MDKNITELREDQEILSSKLSTLLFQTLFIFGIPAVAGYYVGLWLHGFEISKPLAFLPPLTAAFALSWFIFIKRLRVLTAEIKKIEAEIRELQQKEESQKEGVGESGKVVDLE